MRFQLSEELLYESSADVNLHKLHVIHPSRPVGLMKGVKLSVRLSAPPLDEQG